MLKDNIQNANKDAKSYRPKLCVIIGIEKFMKNLKNMSVEFFDILKDAEKKYTFVIADNAAKIKEHQYDNWYKNYVTGDTGIWVGNGIDTQFVFTTNATKKELVSDCGNSFGFYINQGKVVLMKLVGLGEEESNE